MLLPQLNTMLGSSCPLECHVGICNELLNFFVLSWKAFLLTYSTFLRMDTLEIQPLCMNSNVDIVLCYFFAELHVTRSCLLHKFSSRPSHLECCPQVSRFFFKKKKLNDVASFLNLFCNSLHVLLVLVSFVVRDAVDSEINRLFELTFGRPIATP